MFWSIFALNSKPDLDPRKRAVEIEVVKGAAVVVEIPVEIAVADDGIEFPEAVADRGKGLPGQLGLPGPDIRNIGQIPFIVQIGLSSQSDDGVPDGSRIGKARQVPVFDFKFELGVQPQVATAAVDAEPAAVRLRDTIGATECRNDALQADIEFDNISRALFVIGHVEVDKVSEHRPAAFRSPEGGHEAQVQVLEQGAEPDIYIITICRGPADAGPPEICLGAKHPSVGRPATKPFDP